MKLMACRQTCTWATGFNPSGGILVGEAQCFAAHGLPSPDVSIPRAGFWWVKRDEHYSVHDQSRIEGFNPSGGILVGEASGLDVLA